MDVLERLLERAAALAARKKALAETIRDLTLTQAGLLAPEKAGELLALLERRQALMDEVDGIDAEAQALEEEIKRTTGTRPGAGAAAVCRDRWQEVEGLRREVAAIFADAWRVDGENRRRLAEGRGRMKAGLEALQARKGPVQAYRGAGFQGGGFFIDRKE